MNFKGPHRLRTSDSSTKLAARDVRKAAIEDVIAKQYKALFFESGVSRVLRVFGDVKHVQ